jgi:bifunctional non-homologous end joining protein LigD
MSNYQGCKGEIHPLEIDKFYFKKGNYLAEEKYDGIWIDVHYNNHGNVTLISRSGKEKNNSQLESLRKYLEVNLPLKNSNLIGEMAFGSQKGTDYAKAVGHHKIDLFDVVRLNNQELYETPLLERKEILHGLLTKVDKLWIKETPFFLLKDAKKVEKLYQGIISQGGEGLIIKDLEDLEYRPGFKSPYWYKIKKHVSMDYVINGYTETNSADFAEKGWIGGILGGLYVGTELVNKVTVGSMSHQWRAEFSRNGNKYLGQVMEVAGFEIFKSGATRHPSFLRVRDDKKASECVWNI